MSENSSHARLGADPWVASSLLQKTIRRGEAELAQQAATLLHRYRGAAIWRRLMTIAIEDVGIADIALVGEVTRFATDRALRSVLGSDAEIMNELCAKLAAAPKDRSTDYLYSAATAAVRNGAKDVSPLIREAATVLSRCTSAANPLQMKETAVRRFLASNDGVVPRAFEEAIIHLARSGGHPFALMLVPLWSAFSTSASEVTISTEALPVTEFIEGIPVYAFDKHTAVGKQAISRFARENRNVGRALSEWVPSISRIDVTLMAAFYADAVPVARRLDWNLSEPLFEAGFEADMLGAGCRREGIAPVLECVRTELAHLNELRRTILTGRRAQSEIG